MRTIWKFPITERHQEVAVPSGWSPLHVGRDPTGVLCLWAAVYMNAKVATEKVSVVGTGQDLDAHGWPGSYVGTVHEGPMVWHVYATQAHDVDRGAPVPPAPQDAP